VGLGLENTHRHTALGGTTLDDGSARRRDLYLTKHNAHKKEMSMPLVGLQPAILASKQAKGDQRL
jgi:hypothetical protein